MLILILSSGPDKGRVYELHDDQPVVLGREGDPVRLDDRKASRQHARLWAEGGQWFIQDLDSRHGTFLNSVSLGTTREKLHDGDRLRIGNTQLVLARMPVEQAERAQLLGDPASERQARRAVGASGRTLRLAGFAVAASIAAVLGLNVYSLLQSASNTRDLRDRIAAAEPKLDHVEPMLRDILAAIETRPDRDAILASVRAALADQPDHRATLDAILARVDEQSQSLAAVADLHQAMTDQQRAAAETRDTLALVLNRLNEAARPDDTAELRQQLALVLEKLDARPEVAPDAQTLAKLDAVLEKLDAPAAPATDPAVRESLALVLEKLNTPAAPALDADALARQVAEQVYVAGSSDRQTLQRLAVEVAAQRQIASQLDELRQAVASQPEATRAQIDAALAALDVHSGTAQVLAAVESVRLALPADAAQQLDRVIARLDAQTSPAQVAETLTSLVAQQATIEQLRDEVARLAEAQRTTPEAILTEVRAAAAARSDADAKLAEMLELAAGRSTPSERTEQLLQQVLGELRNRSAGQENDVLAGVLRELKGKTVADTAGLRDLIRTELDARLAGLTAAPAVSSSPRQAKTAPALVPSTPDAGPRVSMASALTGSTDEAEDAASGDGLSRTERAYKLAFETGQPVTIGAGQLNPLTGALSEGRTLDPAAAKAAGIKTWRDWYLMDDFAERMRLQQQAMRYRQDNTSANPDLVTLPKPAATP